jgi:hypothetical protein
MQTVIGMQWEGKQVASTQTLFLASPTEGIDQ